jgi:uncharacterized protein
MTQRNSTLRALILFILVFGGGAAIYAAWAIGAYSDARTGSARAATPSASAVDLLSLAEKGETEALKREITAAGVDVNRRFEESGPDRGLTPLMAAARAGHSGIVTALLGAKANPSLSMDDGRTALMMAAIHGDAVSVTALLDAGAVVNARDESGFTALMFASARGSPEAVAVIAARGAEIESRNRWRETALMIAARAGDVAKVGALLNAGANPEAANQDGKSVLNLAAESGADPSLLEMLIRKGGNPNSADNDGVTPLMWAAQRGDAEATAILIGFGAKRDVKSRAGLDAATYAENRGDELGKAVVELLKK